MEVKKTLEAIEDKIIDENLERFKRQYLQMVPLKHLDVPPGDLLKTVEVQDFLYDHMFSFNGPASSFKFKVLKHIIESIESAVTDPDEDEVIENLYSEFASLLPHVPRGPTIGENQPQESVVTFSPPVPLDQHAGIVFQSAEMTNVFSVSGGTGHRTWEASLHLGSFLCTARGRELTRNKTILELGAGRGLVSYVCSSYLEAARVYPTDGDANCVAKLVANPAPPPGIWSPAQLIWNADLEDGTPIPDLDTNAQQDLDLILGADITFDRTLMPDLSRTICHLLKSNKHARAFISATLRNTETFEAFRDACQAEGLELLKVDFDCPEPISQQTGIFHTHEVPIKIVEISVLSTSY